MDGVQLWANVAVFACAYVAGNLLLSARVCVQTRLYESHQ